MIRDVGSEGKVAIQLTYAAAAKVVRDNDPDASIRLTLRSLPISAEPLEFQIEDEE